MSEPGTISQDATGIERSVIGILFNGGSRSLDDIVRAIPGDRFAQVFLTIDRLSRNGLVRLVPECRSYRVSLAIEGRIR